MLLNQLQQLGAPNHEAIPARWMAIISDRNIERHRRGLPPIEFVFTDTAVDAYVNHGAWVADCQCNGGIAVSPDWPLCCCLDCARIYLVHVPPADQIVAATVLLERRPIVNRNWNPTDEPIRLLQAENATHGLDDTIPDAPHRYNHIPFLKPSETVPVGAIHVGNLNLFLGR